MDRNNHIFMPEDHMDNLYNSKNPLVKFVHCQRLDAIVKSIPAQNDINVLDAGCGEGHLINELYKKSHSHYYGVDVTEIAIEKALNRCPFAKFSIADLASLKFEDGFFDVVIATEVLEHIIDYRAAISELIRVLKKGGTLIVTFPNEVLWTISRFFLGRRPVKVPDHVNSFNPSKMKKIVGLQLISLRSLPFNTVFPLSLGCLMKFQK